MMLREDSFSKKWPVVSLSDVVEFLDSRRKPVKASERVEGDYAYYGANGLQGSIDNYIFDEPLVLLAEDGGHFGNPERDIAYIATGKYWVNNHAHVLKPKEGVDLSFLFRVLQRYDVSPFIKGATRAKLTKGDASRIPFPLPPLAEQKRIATILDKADAIRQKRKQAIELADEFLRSVFLEMFGDPVTNPKGWEVSTLNKFGSFKNGMNFSKDEVGNQLYCIGVGDFKSFDRICGTSRLSTINLNEMPDKGYLLQDNDLLFVRSNGNKALVGRCVSVHPGAEEVTYSGFCIRYRIELVERLDADFVNYCLRIPSMKHAMLKGGQGANIQNINQQILSNLQIPVPPIELQKKYATLVASFRELQEKLTSNQLVSQAAFNSLSQKAFSGQL